MITQDLKYAIHESVENIDDEDFLTLIKEMLSRKYENQEKPVFSDKQLEEINRSREQVNQGKFKTEEQIDKMVSEWAKE